MKNIKQYLLEIEEAENSQQRIAKKIDRLNNQLVEQILRNSNISYNSAITSFIKRATKVQKVGYWIHDTRKKLFMGTKNCYAFFEADESKQYLSEEEFFGLIHKDDVDEIYRSYTEALEKGIESGSSYRIKTFKAQIKYVLSHFTPKYDSKGNLYQVNGVLFELLDDSENYIFSQFFSDKSINNNIGVGFWEFNPDKEVEVWSKGLLNIIGAENDVTEPVNDRVFDYIYREDKEFVSNLIKKNNDSCKDYQLTFRINTLDSKIKTVFSQVKNILDPEGNLIKRIGTVFDISEIYKYDNRNNINKAKYYNILNSIDAYFLLGSYDGDIHLDYVSPQLQESQLINTDHDDTTLDKLFSKVDVTEKFDLVQINRETFDNKKDKNIQITFENNGKHIEAVEFVRILNSDETDKNKSVKFIMQFIVIRGVNKDIDLVKAPFCEDFQCVLDELKLEINKMDELSNLLQSFESISSAEKQLTSDIIESTKEVKLLMEKLNS